MFLTELTIRKYLLFVVPTGAAGSAPAVFVSQVASGSLTQPKANVEEDEVRIGMNILGKKRTKTWHRGVLVAITPVGN